MKVIIKQTLKVEEDVWYTSMEEYMKGIGKTIFGMVEVQLNLQMEVDMKEN